MTLRCLEPLALKVDGRAVQFEPGSVFTVTPAQGARVLAKFPTRVEALTPPLDLPDGPLQPGWLVVYRDRAGRLAGGSDDRMDGTVATCTWDGGLWSVLLSNGQSIPLTLVRSVARTDQSGQVLAAWMVREHDYDGEGRGIRQ